ncbi:unnamed protein product [Auanema sp. JU1783]|nr:unnamed protein product [Auanema sp. JU1783]
MHLTILFLFSFVVASHAAALYPANVVNTPCGYCYCCGPVTSQQNPCCAMGCANGNRCPTVFFPAPVPLIETNPPSTQLITETTTALVPTTHIVSPLGDLPSMPSPVPCTIETCPPSPIVDPINLPPNSENFGNLPQGPPVTPPYPNVQIAPIRTATAEESRQVIPCGNNVSPCGNPCTGVAPSAPCGNTQQPCQNPCQVIPPPEAQPCCLVYISQGKAQVFCGCDGNGTCINNPQQVFSTCKPKAVIDVNIKESYIIPCYQAVSFGIKLSEIEGCPADGLSGGATGLTIFLSIALAALSLLLCDS